MKGQEVVKPAAEAPPVPVGNLMDALRQSLQRAKESAPPRRAAGKPPKLAAESAGVAHTKRQRRRKSS